jgi:regulator of protease activity HflC (stomatin/prohibitin superfamily)
MEIKDLLGAGQIGEKLLATLERATGTLYRPLGVRLEAAAEANKMRLLGKAEADKQRALARAEADRKLILAAADEEIAERAILRERARKLQEQRNLDTIVIQAA